MRQKLFDLSQPITLTKVFFELHWPYINNVYYHNETLRARRNRTQLSNYDCRLLRKTWKAESIGPKKSNKGRILLRRQNQNFKSYIRVFIDLKLGNSRSSQFTSFWRGDLLRLIFWLLFFYMPVGIHLICKYCLQAPAGKITTKSLRSNGLRILVILIKRINSERSGLS